MSRTGLSRPFGTAARAGGVGSSIPAKAKTRSSDHRLASQTDRRRHALCLGGFARAVGSPFARPIFAFAFFACTLFAHAHTCIHKCYTHAHMYTHRENNTCRAYIHTACTTCTYHAHNRTPRVHNVHMPRIHAHSAHTKTHHANKISSTSTHE